MSLRVSILRLDLARVILILTYLIGGGSLLIWLIFLFWGSLNLVVLDIGEISRLGFNVTLCFAFFIQHSGMIRKSYRQWLGRFIRADYHSALFTIFSGIFLLLLVIFWQRSSLILMAPRGILRWIFHAIFILAFVGFNWGTRAFGSCDMFGINPILRLLRGTNPPPSMPLTIRGPYRRVRHPLYFFCLLMIWSCPNLSADRLLYNILWTGWIIVGTVLEERDLVAAFGDEYRAYQKNVPMLIPKSIRSV